MKIPSSHDLHNSTPPPPNTTTSDSLSATRLRVLSNAHAIYGSTRCLDVLTYGTTTSSTISAAIVEHNPSGRAFIHATSAPEPSRLAAVEHLLVITEDILARLVEKEGISSSGWLPTTPQTQHAITFGRQNSFSQSQQQQSASRHESGGSPFGSFQNLQSLRYESAPVSRRESVVMGGGRVEGTVTSSNVSTPAVHARDGFFHGGGAAGSHGYVGHGSASHAGALPPIPSPLPTSVGVGGSTALGAPSGASATAANVVVPRPQRTDKVRWIMGSEG
ncbi:unnamed protein product [Periconia digitata]|uniref:Uncharacterized protein n=1 Tax=Periconia digitata TaxID=1303443 RepID=A0A9W4XR72_9PLEO|nr:unnamed protein product [Periconia digitata]